MKKIAVNFTNNRISIIMALFLIVSSTLLMTGCSGSAGNTGNVDSVAGSEAISNSDSDSLKVVATIFPVYDWAREIIKDTEGAQLTLLVDNGSDLHSFQPSAEDIITISTADVFIYVGGESDKWVDDALKQAVNKDMKVINLMDVLENEVVEEEVIEGMEAEEDGEDDEDGEVELDEHVWLSINKAQLICKEITSVLKEADNTNASKYDENCQNYIEKLGALDKEYSDYVSSCSKKTLLFADRFPFRYLVEDYGLSYYAAFSGCSSETEASFETIMFLAERIDEEKIDAIIYLETSDGSIAKTVNDNTTEKNHECLVLDSLQNSEDIQNESYIESMRSNLEILKKALK